MPEKGKRRRVPRWLKVTGIVVLAGAFPVVASAAHLAVLSAGRTHTVDDVPARPVAMVLGAKADPGRPSAFLAARLDLAVDLFQRGKVKAILVSGDGLPRSNNEPEVMRDYLVARGVPEAKIVEDPAGFDTYDSCVRARDVFGVKELTILTQDYHVGRAIAICELVGVDAVGVGDETMRTRFGALWFKGASREWAANLKVEWDTLTRRQPQHNPFDPTLLEAAGLR